MVDDKTITDLGKMTDDDQSLFLIQLHYAVDMKSLAPLFCLHLSFTPIRCLVVQTFPSDGAS